MVGRVKVEVWSPRKQAWRIVYVKRELLEVNVSRLRAFGFQVNISGEYRDPLLAQLEAA